MKNAKFYLNDRQPFCDIVCQQRITIPIIYQLSLGAKLSNQITNQIKIESKNEGV